MHMQNARTSFILFLGAAVTGGFAWWGAAHGGNYIYSTIVAIVWLTVLCLVTVQD